MNFDGFNDCSVSPCVRIQILIKLIWSHWWPMFRFHLRNLYIIFHLFVFFWVPGHDFWTATGPFRPPGQGGGVLFGMGLYYIYICIHFGSVKSNDFIPAITLRLWVIKVIFPGGYYSVTLPSNSIQSSNLISFVTSRYPTNRYAWSKTLTHTHG